MRPPAGFRLGLAGLMALIGAIAAELGLMRSGSEVAVSIAYAILILALAVGLLGAIVRRGSGPWVGFTLFGWGYALLAFTTIDRPLDLPSLPTSGTVEWLADQLRNDSIRDRVGWSNTGKVARITPSGGWVDLTDSPEDNRLRQEFSDRVDSDFVDNKRAEIGKFRKAQWIGHATLTLIFATLGAGIGKALERPRRPEPALVQAGG